MRVSVACGLAAAIVVSVAWSGRCERTLSVAEAGRMYGGNAAPAPNNRCCKVKDGCKPTQESLRCAKLGQTSCTGTLPQYQEVVAENTDKNIKACLDQVTGRNCSVGSTTHVCSRTYTCKWENGACSIGSEIDSTSAADSCGDDCSG